jgi:NADPH:quinone reductase-like Zn-dependent oxidoreductase
MKAVVYQKYGPPEVAQLNEIEKPAPKDNEVLIKVHASSVNRTDCGFRSANYFVVRFFAGLVYPRNKTLGCEFAGTIESIGRNVQSLKAGDKVFGFDDKQFGGHAEYKTMAADGSIATMPEHISFEEAATITEGGHYALCYIRAAKIKGGQNILINGATGAIGSAAVQLIKAMGARVTAVCDTKNINLVRSLGADTVIDYLKEDFTKLNETFDVVFDAVGKSSFGRCKPLLKKGGLYTSTELGRMSQNPFLALITPMLGGKKVLFPIPTCNKEDIVFLRDMVEKCKYKPVIDRRYPLTQIVAAYTYVETGQKTGNVVLTIG